MNTRDTTIGPSLGATPTPAPCRPRRTLTEKLFVPTGPTVSDAVEPFVWQRS